MREIDEQLEAAKETDKKFIEAIRESSKVLDEFTVKAKDFVSTLKQILAILEHRKMVRNTDEKGIEK